jgi:hypothetical protein
LAPTIANYKVTEYSDTHVIIHYNESIEKIVYHDELSSKLMNLHNSVLYVMKIDHVNLKNGFKRTWYKLYFSNDSNKGTLDIIVIDNDGKFSFSVNAADKYKSSKMTLDFLNEVKKLPEYRLYLITQD